MGTKKKREVWIIVHYSLHGEAMIESVFDTREQALAEVQTLREVMPGEMFRLINREVGRSVR